MTKSNGLSDLERTSSATTATAQGTTTGKIAVYLQDMAHPDMIPTIAQEPADLNAQALETAQNAPIVAAHKGPST